MNTYTPFVLAVALAAAGVSVSRAAGTSLECLQASARAGSLGACLDERAPAPEAPPVAAAFPARTVPTPSGWKESKDGTLDAGFCKGLDSGYKVASAAVLSPAVAGLDAAGAPYRDNPAVWFFTGLGLLLAVPAAVVGALIGAPLGAAAGMIAEKAAPGSTRNWFTY